MKDLNHFFFMVYILQDIILKYILMIMNLSFFPILKPHHEFETKPIF